MKRVVGLVAGLLCAQCAAALRTPQKAIARRAFLGDGVAAAAAVASSTTLALGAPRTAVAAADGDALAEQLLDARDGLAKCTELADARDWDAIRRAVALTLSFLSLKGYTGESVKSRALRLGGEAGEKLAAARRALLVELGSLDRLAFDAQLSRGVEPSAFSSPIDASVRALDAVLEAL